MIARVKSLTCAVWLLLLLGSAAVPADTRFPLKTLTPRTLDLLREVEGRYKQPINIVWVERLEPEDRLGEADITPDGALVIRVRRSAPQMSASPLEETIIHEVTSNNRFLISIGSLSMN